MSACAAPRKQHDPRCPLARNLKWLSGRGENPKLRARIQESGRDLGHLVDDVLCVIEDQLGSTLLSSQPLSVLGSGFVQVAAGGDHSLAVDIDGNVWAWGNNAFGQLGDGTTTSRSVPLRVSGLSGVIQVAAGSYHSLAVRSDGTVWAWGINSRGQFG